MGVQKGSCSFREEETGERKVILGQIPVPSAEEQLTKN